MKKFVGEAWKLHCLFIDIYKRMHFKKKIVIITYSVIDMIIILKEVKNIIIVCYNIKLFNQNRIAEFLISHFLHDFL